MESQSYGASRAIWDHTDPTQVSAPHLNPSHAGQYSVYLPRRDGRLSWPCCYCCCCAVQSGACASEYVQWLACIGRRVCSGAGTSWVLLYLPRRDGRL